MIPRILLVKCYIDHRLLAVKPFATSGVTLAFSSAVPRTDNPR
jgi:hypothetical protein